jgi:NTP pyrophosphatase (non-canonical NTP hydrolase)
MEQTELTQAETNSEYLQELKNYYAFHKTKKPVPMTTYQLGEEPEVVHVIKTGFEDMYLMAWEDAYQHTLGKTEFLSSSELKEKYQINIKEDQMEYQKIEVFEKIRNWAQERGIYDKGDKKTQLIKLVEELGELSQSVLKNDEEEFVDAIGDCVVVLTNLAKLGGYDIEHCIQSAYDEIKNRTGKMQNGTYVKN